MTVRLMAESLTVSTLFIALTLDEVFILYTVSQRFLNNLKRKFPVFSKLFG